MKEFLIFIKTYWKHSKDYIDLIFFFLTIFTYINPITDFKFPDWVPVILIISLFLYVSYKTWLYEYEKNNEKEELNDIQKDVLEILKKSNYRKTFRDQSMNVEFIRIGDKNFDQYENMINIDGGELWANIQDLYNKGYLEIQIGVRNEIYSMSKKAFDYLREK